MITPKYWARAAVDRDGNEINHAGGYHGVGWSDTSQADAHQQALARARRIHEWVVIHQCKGPDELCAPYYHERALREPVIDTYHHDHRRIAVVTQNVYGAYVLNTVEAMFIDIDLPAPPAAPGLIGKLFGKNKNAPTTPSATTDHLRSVVDQYRGMGLRLYRTPNGYRGLITDRPYTPGSEEAEQVMQAFAADPLYVSMCKAQQCFRARLTPKPWRIGMDNPPRTFPFAEAAKQRVFDQWQQVYDQRIARYAACEPLSETPWGNTAVHPDIAPVLSLHDQLACSSDKPLA